MKCSKLHPKRRGLLTLHYLWCRECRELRQVDDLIWDSMAPYREAHSLPMRVRPQPMSFSWLAMGAAVLLIAVLLVNRKPEAVHPTSHAFVALLKKPASEFTPKDFTISRHRKQRIPVRTELSNPKPLGVVSTGNLPGALMAPRAGEDFLNQDRDTLAYHWRVTPPGELSLAMVLGHSLPAMKDDFVVLPETQVADTGVADTEAIFAEYERQASISDDRLVKMVTFSSPQDSLQEICESLQRQTGVAVTASRNVADDNICLFIKRRPARDVMRAITKLFGYVWVRTEKDGTLHYSLEQDTKGQIAEENIRKDDVSSAFTRILEANRKASASGLEKAVRKVFDQLTVTELQTLRNGGEVVLTNNPNSNRAIDADIAYEIFDNFGRVRELGPGDFILTGDGVRPTEVPGTQLTLTYSISIEEFGGATAKANVNVTMAKPGGGMGTSWNRPVSLAVVPGSGESAPNNALASADQAKIAVLNDPVTVTPSESVAPPREERAMGTGAFEMGTMTTWRTVAKCVPPGSYTTQGELWLAIQAATKFDIVADSFSRLISTRTRTGKVFDLLNQYGDQTRFRWRFEDGVLYSRSTTFAWERLNEVPKKLVQRWKKQSQNGGHLPAQEIVNICQLSDRQLDSWSVGQRIYHREGVVDWGIVSRPWLKGYPANLVVFRQIGRSLVNVSPSTLEKLGHAPVAFASLTGDIVNGFLARFGPWKAEPAFVALDYVPSNSAFWSPKSPKDLVPSLGIYAETREEIPKLLESRKLALDQGTVVKTGGHWSLVFFDAQGNVVRRVGDDGQIITVF